MMASPSSFPSACCCAVGRGTCPETALLPLHALASGQSACVRGIRAQGELGRRLRDMGLLPGVQLTLSRRAPLGDPIVVTLDGYDLSLRCEEAGQVMVELIQAFPQTVHEGTKQ